MPGADIDEFDNLRQPEGDQSARRALKDAFGSEVPIPAATMLRNVRYQEAARLYIHHRWSFGKIFKALMLPSESYLSEVAREDDWNGFASEIFAVLKPSLWVQKDFEVLDHRTIAEEGQRRMANIARLRTEEDKVMKMMEDAVPGSKQYNAMVASLRSIRALIDQTTGVNDHRAEQSKARQLINKKNIEQEFVNKRERERQMHRPPKLPGDDAKRVGPVNIFDLT